MAENNNDAAELHPSQVIGAYGQPLVAGRRVAVLGDCTTGLPEVVAKASGRRVHAYDPNRERVATALARFRGRRGPRVTHALLDESLDSRDGVFDAVVIADLSELRDVEAPLQLAQSLLSPRGLLLLASPNPDRGAADDSGAGGSTSYYDLYDRLSEVFDQVRMLGQAPFLGYTVAEFAAEGEPSVTIDSSLVSRSEEPAYYVAVASNRAIDLDPYTLIQVPAEAGCAWLWPTAAAAAGPVDAEATAQAQRERAALAGELDTLRARNRDTERLARERRDAATALSARVAELEAALQDKTRQVAADDKRRDAATTLSARVAELEAALKDQTRQVAADDKRRSSLAVETTRKLRASEEERKRRTSLAEETARELRASEDERKRRTSLAEETARELRASEGELKRERERFEQDQLAAEEAHQLDLDRMLERIAELEGDVEGDQIEGEESGPATETDDAPSPGAVKAYEFQLSELKKALAQTRGEASDLRAEAARVAALEAELATTKLARDEAVALAEQRAGIGSDEATAQQHGDEIDELERHLKERGAMVGRLQAELKEGERVGRELLRELELTRTAPDAGQPGEPPQTDETGAMPAATESDPTGDAPTASQLEALVQKCCRYEADAQAKVDERQTEAEVDDQLAEALRAAQQELAELRRRLPSDSDQ
ncbi:MAG: hypothetical protein JRI68_32945 [Deltaproteobacteria bacterium]|nr:hypothetical protein [Deltaproteobacteria bacterium]